MLEESDPNEDSLPAFEKLPRAQLAFGDDDYLKKIQKFVTNLNTLVQRISVRSEFIDSENAKINMRLNNIQNQNQRTVMDQVDRRMARIRETYSKKVDVQQLQSRMQQIKIRVQTKVDSLKMQHQLSRITSQINQVVGQERERNGNFLEQLKATNKEIKLTESNIMRFCETQVQKQDVQTSMFLEQISSLNLRLEEKDKAQKQAVHKIGQSHLDMQKQISGIIVHMGGLQKSICTFQSLVDESDLQINLVNQAVSGLKNISQQERGQVDQKLQQQSQHTLKVRQEMQNLRIILVGQRKQIQQDFQGPLMIVTRQVNMETRDRQQQLKGLEETVQLLKDKMAGFPTPETLLLLTDEAQTRNVRKKTLSKKSMVSQQDRVTTIVAENPNQQALSTPIQAATLIEKPKMTEVNSFNQTEEGLSQKVAQLQASFTILKQMAESKANMSDILKLHESKCPKLAFDDLMRNLDCFKNLLSKCVNNPQQLKEFKFQEFNPDLLARFRSTRLRRLRQKQSISQKRESSQKYIPYYPTLSRLKNPTYFNRATMSPRSNTLKL